MVRLLLALGADVEARRTRTDNATAFMASMAKNLTRVSEALFTGGADPFAEDEGGRSPHLLSIQEGAERERERENANWHG